MRETHAGICLDCRRNPETSMYRAVSARHAAESRQRALHDVCTTCARDSERPPCEAMDCPVLYTRLRNDAEVEHTRHVQAQLEEHLEHADSDPWTW